MMDWMKMLSVKLFNTTGRTPPLATSATLCGVQISRENHKGRPNNMLLLRHCRENKRQKCTSFTPMLRVTFSWPGCLAFLTSPSDTVITFMASLLLPQPISQSSHTPYVLLSFSPLYNALSLHTLHQGQACLRLTKRPCV